MWNLVPSSDKKLLHLPTYTDRVHLENPLAKELLSLSLSRFLTNTNYTPGRELVILCIGTDRSTGDSLGPLTGSKLFNYGLLHTSIYGTLDQPVHAANLAENLAIIGKKHDHPLILAIDACLGKTDNVGYISVKEGPLRPGTGVNKDLPAVGDLHMIGVVNVGGFMEYLVLQNTRLSLVMRMADIISGAIYQSVSQLARHAQGCP